MKPATPQKIAKRASIVLFSGHASAPSRSVVARRALPTTVWRWQKAYRVGGVERVKKDKGKGPRAGKLRGEEAYPRHPAVHSRGYQMNEAEPV